MNPDEILPVHPEAAGELDKLRRENERLKAEVTRLRELLVRRGGDGMSSRLKDALRE